MKKRIFIITLCIVLAVFTLALSACSENTDKAPVPTDDLSNAVLQDNGGMSVQYGNYVYFINGYAGETASNAFGEVIRGAICRTTLNEEGIPDYTSVEIIVGKNVYGEDTTYGGIYIVNDYIYYNTTSVDKDSSRQYKSDEGVLMRTSIDGSKTEVVKELDDNDIVLYAGDNSNYLAYVYDSYVYLVDKNNGITLLSKSNAINPTSDKQTAVAYKFGGDYLVYTMYNYADEDNYSSDYIVWACNLKTGEQKAVLSSDIYNGNTDRTILYTTTIQNVVASDDGFTIFYSKKGNNSAKNDGFYSCTFSADLTKGTEVRYTHETSVNAYTQFYTLNNGYVLAFYSNLFDVYDAEGNKVMDGDMPMRLNFEETVTIIDLVETETEVYVYYLYSSKFYYVRLFDVNQGVYTVSSTDAISFFAGTYNSTYTSYDLINNVIYYFDDNMEDNAYYYVIPTLADIDNDTDKSTGKILGIISDVDMITLTSED